VHDYFSARKGVEDDNLSIIRMGARAVGSLVASELVEAFMMAEFSGAARHRRRLRKVAALETVMIKAA
jgi:ribose 5-phosphate isomerase B